MPKHLYIENRHLCRIFPGSLPDLFCPFRVPKAVAVLCYHAHVFNCNWTYGSNLRCHLGQLACCSGGSPLRCLILVTSTIHNQLSNEANDISHRHQYSALVSVAEIKLGGKYSFSTPTCCSIESGCMTKQDTWVR